MILQANLDHTLDALRRGHTSASTKPTGDARPSAADAAGRQRHDHNLHVHV
jgi:hypothetical protein